MYEHQTELRVRYGETDQMGYLYYGHYALYYEVGRVEAIRHLGYSYKEMEEEGIFMPVQKMEVTYLRPAKYDDLITIKTSIPLLPDRKILFRSELYDQDEKLLNVGIVKLVFFDPKTQKSIPAPQKLTDKLKPYFK